MYGLGASDAGLSANNVVFWETMNVPSTTDMGRVADGAGWFSARPLLGSKTSTKAASSMENPDPCWEGRCRLELSVRIPDRGHGIDPLSDLCNCFFWTEMGRINHKSGGRPWRVVAGFDHFPCRKFKIGNIR